MTIAETKRVQDPKRQRNNKRVICLPVSVGEDFDLVDAKGRVLVVASLSDFTESQDMAILRELADALNHTLSEPRKEEE